MKTLEQILTARLSVPVRNKAGQTLTNEQGEELLPMEAMVMSVMQNAMRGDIQSITFIRNFTQKATDDPLYRTFQEQQEQQNEESIRAQFVADGIYDPSIDFQIEQLANTLLIVQRLERQMRESAHNDIQTDVSRTGQTTIRLSQLDDIRNKQLEKFNADLQQLRSITLQRVAIRQQNEKKKKR